MVVFYEVYYTQDDELCLQGKGLLHCKQTAVPLGWQNVRMNMALENLDLQGLIVIHPVTQDKILEFLTQSLLGSLSLVHEKGYT